MSFLSFATLRNFLVGTRKFRKEAPDLKLHSLINCNRFTRASELVLRTQTALALLFWNGTLIVQSAMVGNENFNNNILSFWVYLSISMGFWNKFRMTVKDKILLLIQLLRLSALAINRYGWCLSPSARAPQDDVWYSCHSEGVKQPKNPSEIKGDPSPSRKTILNRFVRQSGSGWHFVFRFLLG